MMKKNFVFCLFSTITVLFSYGQTGDYKLIWQDSFDGTSLDDAKWNVEVNGDGGGNSELQYYRRENVSVGEEPSSGENCLILTAREENFSGRTCTSGRIRTYGKMSFKYGKIEGRIKLPKTANGLWPAFWMLGADYGEVGWPKCGEIDILEMGNVNGIRNNTQEYYFGGHFHWGEDWNGGAYPNWGRAHTNPYSLQDDFHLFTLVWDADFIKMYLDLDKYPGNEPYLEMGIGGGTGPGQVGRYFHKPYNVILNLAVGGNFTGIWNINDITALNAGNGDEAKMYVDYVRVYQRGDAGEEFHAASSSSLEYAGAGERSYTIYPNPAFSHLYIEGSEKPEKICIYNMQGMKIMEAKNTFYLNISSLPGDNYIIKITKPDGIFETHNLSKAN